MKLLIISNNPSRASYRQRIGIYVAGLGEKEINCELAKLPKRLFERWKIYRSARNFDAVFLHKKCLNFFDAKILRKYATKIIYDFDDAVMYSPKKPGVWSYSHYMPFRRTVKLADMVIAGNSYLAGIAGKYNENIHVIPTGLDTTKYKISALKKDNKVRLVWIGSKSTLRYLEEIGDALDEIGTRYNNVMLRVISDEFIDFKNIAFENIKWTLENEGRDLAECDIGIAPLPEDNFTKGKCGFKILQYMAAGLAVVASPVGVNSEIVKDGENGFWARNVDGWIEKLSTLIENRELVVKMGMRNLEAVKKYDKRVIDEKLYKLIRSVCNQKSDFQPLVSICVPTYNRKEYLREAIKSVLEQSYKNIELVVLDDGSTDGTDEMIKGINFPIRYYRQENKGDAAARNKLIELANADYISFLDSDDKLVPDAIERLIKAMGNSKDTITYGSYYRINENGRIYGKCKRRLYSGRITEKLFETIMVHSCGSLFPKKILTESGGFDESLNRCSDYDMWLRLSLKYNFTAVSSPTFQRRRHLWNLSSKNSQNSFKEYLVLSKFYEGNKNLIGQKTANKVLSKAVRRAGKLAVRENLFNEAEELLKKSIEYQKNLKAYLYLFFTLIKKYVKKII